MGPSLGWTFNDIRKCSAATINIKDSDSKSYHDIVCHDSYRGIQLGKAECMANIEKRVASRLMSYGKPVEVKGHLTERIIKTLLNFLGSC